MTQNTPIPAANGSVDGKVVLCTAAGVPYTAASAGTGAAPSIVAESAPSSRWFYAGVTGGITDTNPVAVKTAGGAGVINYLSALQAYNSSAVPSEITISSAATVIWRGYAPATSGRIEAVFEPPLQSAANEALNVTMITTGTATRVSAQGYSV